MSLSLLFHRLCNKFSSFEARKEDKKARRGCFPRPTSVSNPSLLHLWLYCAQQRWYPSPNMCKHYSLIMNLPKLVRTTILIVCFVCVFLVYTTPVTTNLYRLLIFCSYMQSYSHLLVYVQCFATSTTWSLTSLSHSPSAVYWRNMNTWPCSKCPVDNEKFH